MWKSTCTYTIHGYIRNNMIGLFMERRGTYLLFVTKEMFEEIAEQTNTCTVQALTGSRSCRPNKSILTKKYEAEKNFRPSNLNGISKITRNMLTFVESSDFSSKLFSINSAKKTFWATPASSSFYEQ